MVPRTGVHLLSGSLRPVVPQPIRRIGDSRLLSRRFAARWTDSGRVVTRVVAGCGPLRIRQSIGGTLYAQELRCMLRGVEN